MMHVLVNLNQDLDHVILKRVVNIRRKNVVHLHHQQRVHGLDQQVHLDEAQLEKIARKVIHHLDPIHAVVVRIKIVKNVNDRVDRDQDQEVIQEDIIDHLALIHVVRCL